MTEYTNFKITQGDTFQLAVTYVDPLGSPINISDFQILFRVKNDFGGKVVCAEASVGTGITKTDPVNGEFVVAVSSAKFTLPRSAYQLKIAPIGEDIELNGETLASGYILVEKGTI